MAKPTSKKKRPAGGVVDVTRLLDDRWLNQTEQWLDEITAGAERTFGKKPAIAEFKQLLATVLTAGPVQRWFRETLSARK